MIAILAAEQFRCDFVADERLLHRIEHQRLSRARGDVAEVAERGGEMIDRDVGVELRAGADGIEKIAVMRCEVRP